MMIRVLQEYYQTHQLRSETPSAISWIGSLQMFFLFGSALIGGPLFDMFGAKVRTQIPSVTLPEHGLKLSIPDLMASRSRLHFLGLHD